MKLRIGILAFCFVLLWAALLIRSFQLQLWPDSRLVGVYQRQFKSWVSLKNYRAPILDRNGRELAVSVLSHSLYADPKLIKNPKMTSRTLSRILPMSQGQIYKKIKNKKRRFVWIYRNLGEKVKDKIALKKIKGIAFVEEPMRVYPQERLLSQVLGFVGRDGHGLEGLEYAYDKELKGESLKLQVQRDAKGRPLVSNGHLFYKKTKKKALYLSLDADLQHKLEKELLLAVEKHQAKSALGVVAKLDGSILAMANIPDYDPNHFGKYSSKSRRNRSITDAFEPGSTMKTFIVASALKESRISPNTKFYAENGAWKLGGRTITEADKKHKFKDLTVTDILANSSNIGIAKLAFKLGQKKVRKTLKDFGLGEKTKVQFPGEATGVLKPLPWREHTFATISFGQSITVTPLQMVMAYGAIANGGKLYRPRLVEAIQKDQEVKKFKPEKLRRVLSQRQAEILKYILVRSASKTQLAQVPNYPVAGKTGTAQKVDFKSGGYKKDAYISSFAGFLPAQNPEFVIYIVVDEPKKFYYGSQVAAPVFSKVATFAVRQLGLRPLLMSGEGDKSLQRKVSSVKKDSKAKVFRKGHMPNLMGLSLRRAILKLQNSSFKIHTSGSGWVKKTYPSPGQELSKAKPVHIYLGLSGEKFKR